MNDRNTLIQAAPRTIGFLLFPGFQLLDLAGPLAAFQMADVVTTGGRYEPLVLSCDGDGIPATMALEVSTVAMADPAATSMDTLVVVGGIGVHEAGAELIEAIRLLAERARRVASVCTGAFLLAQAGLLDGRRATTHWRHAARLQREHPDVRVDADRIYVKDGPIWSSAGITAGIDLALALIEEDHDAELAKAVARELVVGHRRAGGQSQHSEMVALEPESDRIRRVLTYARAHLDRPLDGETLADQAALSLRQFNRVFRDQTGETPAKAIERLRVEAARARVEGGNEPIESIGAQVGFTDPDRMRRAFLRRFGHPPQALRRIARQVKEAPAPGAGKSG